MLEQAIKVDPTSMCCNIENASYLALGFGTYPLVGQICTQAVRDAFEAGYRIFDTATYYKNFHAIATGLSKEKREEVYIISKVWHDSLMPESIEKDIQRTLEGLQTDYLDAYLIHWPNSEVPIEKTLGFMEGLRKSKKIRHIGLSNVTVNHLKKALSVGVAILWVQVEMHPYFYDEELLKFCQQHSLAIQAWSPLARGRICDDPFLLEIGQKYGKSASQVALRWVLQHRCLPLPSSKSETHIRHNKQIFDFSLSSKDMEDINQRARLGKRKRIDKERMGFGDEFDFSYEQCYPK